MLKDFPQFSLNKGEKSLGKVCFSTILFSFPQPSHRQSFFLFPYTLLLHFLSPKFPENKQWLKLHPYGKHDNNRDK